MSTSVLHIFVPTRLPHQQFVRHNLCNILCPQYACVQWWPGVNVGQGNDFTLYSQLEDTGIVVFETIKSRKAVRCCACRQGILLRCSCHEPARRLCCVATTSVASWHH